MKHLVVIAILTCFAWFDASATHILGGEITYKHRSDYTYDVYVTIYRDCNECKLAGGGGGFVTKDCGDFLLYVNRASQSGGCSDSSLGSYTVKRESIKQIVPTCDNVQTICDSRSGLRFGLEAHTFVTTIDFANYEQFKSCGFNLYVHTSSRAEDIDNLYGGEQNYYNYAFIDPFVAHNAPEFTPEPNLVLPLNQAVKTVILGNHDADSVFVKFATPLRDYNKPISYSSGYSANMPITVWCNGDPSCKANPIPTKPIGIQIDPKSGYLTFTPVKNDEKATVVYEIQAFKMVSGAMKLVSVVRRDVQLEISSIAANNNAPEVSGTSIDASNTIHACEGEDLCFDITAKDIQFKYPDGSYQTANEVTYDWETNINGANIAQSTISNAPYNKLSVCWNPSSNDVGQEFHITVVATDDNCPVRASQSAIYKIVVHPKPKATFSVKELWCSNVGLSVSETNLMQLSWEVHELGQETPYFVSGQNNDTFKVAQPGRFEIQASAQNSHGCTATFNDTVHISPGQLYDDFTQISGEVHYCEGDTITLAASGESPVELSQIAWYSGQDTTLGVQFTEVAAESFVVFFEASGVQHGMTCKDTAYVPVQVTPSPIVEFTAQSFACLSDRVFDLREAVRVQGGSWTAIGHNNIVADKLVVGGYESSETPVLFAQEYRLTDGNSGCSKADTFELWMYPSPKFSLDTSEVCGNSGVLNLKTMSDELFTFGDYDIQWVVDGMSINQQPDGSHHLVQMADLTVGPHHIVGTLSDEFGCSTTDSSLLIKLENINLSGIKPIFLCQEDKRHLNDVFNLNLVGGNWTAYQPYQGVQNGFLDSAQCGTFDLNYTYDRFGCYATKDVTVQVTCKPNVTFEYPDTVCTSIDEIVLQASPKLGRFDGLSVDNDILKINNVGPYAFVYLVEHDQCMFKYPGQILAVEAPSFDIVPEFPERICEGESLDSITIHIQDGKVDFTLGSVMWSNLNSDTTLSYQPRIDEVDQGFVNFGYQVTGNGQCPPVANSGQVKISPKPTLEISDAGLIGCIPYDFTPTVINRNPKVDWGAATYTWHYGEKNVVSLNGAYQFTETGARSVVVDIESKYGCTYRYVSGKFITTFDTPKPRFTTDPSGVISVRKPTVQFLNFTSCVDSVTYRWDFGTGRPQDISRAKEPIFTFPQDTAKYTVTLTVTSINGCSAQETYVVELGADIKIFIPTAFSPNKQDVSLNDAFGVKGLNIASYDIQIINKFGQTVFTSTSIDEEWDGMYKGKPCMMGSYMYIVKAVSHTGEVYRFSGALNLIR